jgi:hypothetical protein
MKNEIDGSIGDADAHGLDVVGVGLGAKRNNGNEFVLLRTRKMRKEAVLNSV